MAKTSYAKKLYLQAEFKFLGVIILLVAVLVADFKYGIGKTNLTFKTLELLIATLFGFALYPIITRAFKKNEFKNVPNTDSSVTESGTDSGKAIASWLDGLLPKKNYTILKNVSIPGHKLDIDFVIVGPKGVIIFEAKNFSTQVSFSEDEYFRMVDGKKQVLPFDDDPRTQIKRHVNLLRKHFEDCGLYNLRILKAVVFAKEDTANLNGKPGVYIINGQENLTNYLNRTTELPEYTKDYCQKIIKCLVSK